MKELLIIRTVSFQQIDLNLPEITKKFPDYKISLLTHEHGISLATKYKHIDNIYCYSYKGAFNKKNKVDEFKDKKFDVVLLPVANLSGAGYNNAFEFILTIIAREKYLINLISEIKVLTNFEIKTKLILSKLYKVVSIILTVIFSVLFAFPFLLFNLISKKSPPL